MKKSIIGLLFFSFLGFTACKKENNPKEPESKNTTTSESETTKYAIKKEQDGKYSFQLNLEKGKIYPINSNVTNQQSYTMQGQKNEGTTNQQTNMNIEVKEITPKSYKTQVTITSAYLKQTQQGQETVIDTKAAAPKDKQLAMMWKMQKAMTNAPFNLEISTLGKVIKISGLELLYKKVEEQFKKELKPQELQMMMAQVKQSMNEEMMKSQFEKGINKFPDHSIAIGEVWVEENNNDAEKLKQKTTYKLKEVNSNVAIVSLQGVANQKNEQSDKKAGIKQSVIVNANTKGNIVYDIQSGWIKSSSTEKIVRAKQSMTYLTQNQSQSVEVYSKEISKINQ